MIKKRSKFLTKAICIMLIMLLSMGSAIFAYADVNDAFDGPDILVSDLVDLPEIGESEEGAEKDGDYAKNVGNDYGSYNNVGDGYGSYSNLEDDYNSYYNYEEKYEEELEEEKLIAPMLFSTFSTMLVPGGAPVETASDWASLEAAVASVASGDVVINLTDNITGIGQDHAILIPAGVNVWLVGNGFSIYQDSTFVQGPPVGAGSYSFQRRHFIVDGSLYFDNVALTRSAGVTHRGGGIVVRSGGHLEMFAGAEISNNIATEYSCQTQTQNATENGGAVYLVGGYNSFIMHGGQIIDNHALHHGGGIASWPHHTATTGANIIINNGLISNNTAAYGGGISIRSGSTVTLQNSEVSNNDVATMGGGIALFHSTLIIHDSVISENTAGLTTSGNGGGIRAVGSNITMHSGQISGNTVGVNGGGVSMINASSGTTSVFTMYDGEISDNHTVFNGPWNEGGGGVMIESYVTFNMHGGKIVDNSSVMFGGGVFVFNATFNMFDDAVIANNEGVWGGGVCLLTMNLFQLTNTSTFVMNGGEIRGNAASGIGGGVLVFSVPGSGGSTFTMHDGIIGGDAPEDANTASEGGGVLIEGSGIFTMNDGSIIGNVAGNTGGGIDFNGTNPFTMNGGEISDNTAVFGGGVHIRSTRTFNMNNGEISGNTATSQGGGLFVGGIFNMNNGEIDDNQAVLGGGMLVMFADTVSATINAGSITNNTATANGGGIFAVNYERLTISDTVVFSGNAAATAHNWFLHPDFATGIVPAGDSGGGQGGGTAGIQWASVSIPSTHALNNFDINFTGPPHLNIYTITYRPGTNATGAEIAVNVQLDQNTSIFTAAQAVGFARAGYRIRGWNTAADGSGQAFALGAAHTVTGNLILYAIWERIPTPPPPGGNGGGGTTIIEDDRPPLVFIEDHIWYVRGFPEGDFRPGNSITRAEISMILWRLLDSNAKYEERSNNFSDVSTGWYARAVSYLSFRGIVQGYPDGTFRPNAPITRAELVAMMSRFWDMDENGVNNFSDVSDTHWALAYIMNANSKGWVEGFPDGTFRPNNSTTRAEAVTVMNRVLERVPNPVTINYHLENYVYELIQTNRLFTDLTNTHWAFYHIMEAAIEHIFTLDEEGREVWSEVSIPWLDFDSPRL